MRNRSGKKQTPHTSCAYDCVNKLPVSERGDDESLSTTSVFITVVKINIRNLNETAIRVFNEVKSRLFEPFKVTGRFNVKSTLKLYKLLAYIQYLIIF